MAVRKDSFIVGEYYHLYNRGILKNRIFLDESDKKRLLRLLFVCNSDKPVVFKLIQGLPLDKIERGGALVDIGAYCFMPNHFHILVRERTEDGISTFMEKISTAYVMYFNTRHERTGRLFEGTFKSRHVDSEQYLNWLFTYIHLNPVKLIDSAWKERGISHPGKAKKFMENYLYSSYHDYFLPKRPEGDILNQEEFPDYFADMNDFTSLLAEWEKSHDGGFN